MNKCGISTVKKILIQSNIDSTVFIAVNESCTIRLSDNIQRFITHLQAHIMRLRYGPFDIVSCIYIHVCIHVCTVYSVLGTHNDVKAFFSIAPIHYGKK